MADATTKSPSVVNSSLSGQLSIKWQTADNMLILIWEETGGPPVREPNFRGFGTRGIMASIESQLGGQALFDWRAEGLLCQLLVPVTQWMPAQSRDERYQAVAGEGSFQTAAQ